MPCVKLKPRGEDICMIHQALLTLVTKMTEMFPVEKSVDDVKTAGGHDYLGEIFGLCCKEHSQTRIINHS